MSTLIIEHGGRGVVTVTLARPDKGNAFDQPMLNALGACCGDLAGDTDARIIVVRGQGRHFCTGADIGGSRTGAGGLTMNDVFAQLDRLPKPTIAVIHGGCVGGGIGFAACCDIVLAQPDAFFSIPELRVGRAPSPAFTALLARALGPRALRRYGLTGERIDADTAHKLGLVHEICAPEDVEGRLEALADALLHAAPQALAMFKHRIRGEHWPTEGRTFSTQPDRGDGGERPPEAVEGVAAFREKRKPNWYPGHKDRSTGR